MLFLVPLAPFLSGSISSGGGIRGLYFPFAMVLVVWGLAFDGLRVDRLAGALGAFALVQLALFGFFYKLNNLYTWQGYRAAALTDPRIVTTTVTLGRMPIEPGLLALIAPVCAVVRGADSSLLSLPFPYANYVCGVPSWKGYVQTFFATSSKATIDGLMADLNAEPPKYILYQRQLVNLARHERLYNGSNPLPHRALDEYIARRITAGDWKVVAATAYGIDSATGTWNLWLLIEPSWPGGRLPPRS